MRREGMAKDFLDVGLVGFCWKLDPVENRDIKHIM